jgi:hypothetical protein
MVQKILIYAATNISIIVTLMYLLYTEQTKASIVPVASVICFVFMNALVFYLLKRKAL